MTLVFLGCSNLHVYLRPSLVRPIIPEQLAIPVWIPNASVDTSMRLVCNCLGVSFYWTRTKSPHSYTKPDENYPVGQYSSTSSTDTSTRVMKHVPSSDTVGVCGTTGSLTETRWLHDCAIPPRRYSVFVVTGHVNEWVVISIYAYFMHLNRVKTLTYNSFDWAHRQCHRSWSSSRWTIRGAKTNSRKTHPRWMSGPEAISL